MSRGRFAATAGVVALVTLLSGNFGFLEANAKTLDSRSSEVSRNRTVVVTNATPEQQDRLEEALERFRGAGLALPPVHIVFDSQGEQCGGHLGVFQPQHTPWRIVICSGLDAVYEHELAHAWELANLDDATRQEFMQHRELASWNGADVPWNQRGNEQAAFVIHQGLIDQPLPPTLSAENRSRLIGYAILTGTPAPRLLRWSGLEP